MKGTTPCVAKPVGPHFLQATALLEGAIAAANNNACVLRYRLANEWWSVCWTEEVICRHPPMRVEFENAIVLSSLSEALSIRKNKSSWGSLVTLEPLRADVELHPIRITYFLKANSRIRQRWEFRDTFKAILGKHRSLVNDAVRLSKREFLATIDDQRTRTLFLQLRLTPGDFWIACRHGERYGPNGIHKFVQRLKERTTGYEFEF